MRGDDRWAQSLKFRRWSVLIGVMLFSLSFIVGILAKASASPESLQAPTTKLNPEQSVIKLEFPYTGNDLISATQAAGDFAALLGQQTGLTIEVSLQPCETLVVEHLGNGQADVATIRSFAYVLGHDLHGIEAKLVNGRAGSFSFRGQFNVQTAAGYTSLWDLQGKRFVAPSPDSTTGYLAPYILISQTTGMKPTDFFSEVSFVGSHSQVIRDVYSGTVDAGSTYDDARASVLGELPDVNTVVSVLTYTEPLPNEPWVVRAGLDPTTVQNVLDGIVTVAGTPDGENALETILGYAPDGIGVIADDDYDIYRSMIDEFGFGLAECNRIYTPIIVKE